VNGPLSDARSAEKVQEVRARLAALRDEVHRVIVGQDALIERMLVAILCAGHVLLEGVPGLAKSLCASTLAAALDASFQRIQFTPDLLPGDLLGGDVYDARTQQFAVRRGPVFAHVVLADEINRAPAKVQSALLEAMQERQVTIGGTTLPLPEPFIVIATQNPVEQEGTFPLPEAQADRFFLKVRVAYPGRDEERQIVERMALTSPPAQVRKVLTPREMLDYRRVVDGVRVERSVLDYALEIVNQTRAPHPALELQRLVEWGASPRASVHLVMASRARALLDGRVYATPDDVRDLAPDVLRHRIVLSFEAAAESMEPDGVIRRILDFVPVP